MRRLLALTLLLGCSAREERVAAPAKPQLFGNDRVAEVLSADPARAPRTFAEHESLFGVGRSCGRADSREIYVIEEPATRFAELIVPRATISPRAIVTGCNPTPSSLDGVAVSFGLFTVMPTDPSRSGDDPLARTPIEVMALDRTTGTYSFYVFDEVGVQRIVRDASGAVSTILGRRDGTLETRAEPGKRCFGCHVHGGPLMAALSDPWTSWVSTRTEKPIGSYAGETASIVSETNQLATSRRGGFANALEGVMRNALRTFAVGKSKGQGLVARTLDGAEPGGLPLLLRSVFCETELEFVSTFETVPIQLAIDGATATAALVSRPIAPPGDTFPQLLPIRSELDRRIEEGLVMRGVLSSWTVRAIRFLDDTNDIFSAKRCEVLPRVLTNLPTDLSRVDAHVRAVVRDALPADATYPRALLSEREDGREPYLAAIRARFDAEMKDRALLESRLRARQAAARAMFPANAHPLPYGVAAP